MTIYNYDEKTYELVSESIARVNPLEPGKFLLPANATVKPPLPSKADNAVCFIDGGWVYAADNRNKVYYRNDKRVIFSLGDEITASMRVAQYTDAELQVKAEAGIKLRFKQLYLGVIKAKLDELDYDNIATVKIWEDDAEFGAEATKIINWYKSVIRYNYSLISDGIVPTNEEYLSGMPQYT